MTNLELLDILGGVKGKYVLQAQQLRSGQGNQRIRKLPGKRVFLIAAIISLLLLLVGCAAVLVGLQKISLGRVTFPQYSQPGWTMDLVSTNGYLDSVNYQATREWLDFLTSYDPDRSLEQEKDTNGYTAPEDYLVYNCYTLRMQEKVDEICEKYDLALAGPVYFTQEPEQVFSAVGIPSMMHKSSEAMFTLSGGAYYRSGSFNMAGMVNHCFQGRDTADAILFVYTCDRKSVFFPDYVALRDMEAVDTWEYTAWDGTTLVLAQSPTQGVIAADVGDCFLSVTLSFSYSTPHGDVKIQNPCSREDFEWIADDFAYQITPQKPGPDWLQHPNGLNAGGSSQTYAQYFEQWLPGSVGSEAYSPDYQQRFVDLDGDGADEMLIWNARTGVVYEVVTMVDGEPQCVYGGGTYGQDDHTVSLYLCEGNALEKDCGALQGKQLTEYYRLRDHRLVMAECVLQGSDGKYYWSESGGMWNEITEAEYHAVREKYVRMEGTAANTALAEDGKAGLKDEAGNALLAVLKNESVFCRSGDGMADTLTDYCRGEGERMGFPVSITRWALVDMDGDGAAEAIVDFQFGENTDVMRMVLKYACGSVFGTEFYQRQMFDIKEDGTFAYSGGEDNDGWGRLRWREDNTWETQNAAEPGADIPDVTWYAYPVGGTGPAFS